MKESKRQIDRWKQFNSIIDNKDLKIKEKGILLILFRYVNKKNNYASPSRTLIKQLTGITDIDLYKKTERNMKSLNIGKMTIDDINQIAYKFYDIAVEHGIKIERCSEDYDLITYGIEKGKCIDDNIVSNIIGYEIEVKN